MPNTNIRAGVSYKIFHRPDSNKKDEISLYPDHEVTTTYEDFKNGVDTQMEWVRKYVLNGERDK